MPNINSRRIEQNEIKMKKGAKTQLIIMIISVVIMIFTVTQVYFLARYTFGFEVEEKHLGVYKWMSMLLD